jgi:hypothetical protein
MRVMHPVGKQQGAADCCSQSTEQEPSQPCGSLMLGTAAATLMPPTRITALR